MCQLTSRVRLDRPHARYQISFNQAALRPIYIGSMQPFCLHTAYKADHEREYKHTTDVHVVVFLRGQKQAISTATGYQLSSFAASISMASCLRQARMRR